MQEFIVKEIRLGIELSSEEGMPHRLQLMDELLAEADKKIDQQDNFALSSLKMFLNLNHEINRDVVMIPNYIVAELLDIIETPSPVINIANYIQHQTNTIKTA